MVIDCLCIFVVTKTLPALDGAVGVGWLFIIFSGVCFAMAVFCYLCVPETYGKSLEEIEEHYRKLSGRGGGQ